jgi:hypothetical protein
MDRTCGKNNMLEGRNIMGGWKNSMVDWELMPNTIKVLGMILKGKVVSFKGKSFKAHKSMILTKIASKPKQIILLNLTTTTNLTN